MHALVFIAVYIVKPALVLLMIVSCIIAAYILTKPTTTNKGKTRMKQQITTRQARKMIKAIGRQKTAQLLASKGLTLKEIGIM